MMHSAYVIFTLSASYFTAVKSISFTGIFNKRETIHLEGTVYQNVTQVRSSISCAVLCLSEPCSSFSFDQISKTCGLSWFEVQLITDQTGAAGPDIDIYDRVTPCDDDWVWNPFRNTCVMADVTNVNYTTAQDTCRELSGWLVILDSDESVLWMKTLRNNNAGWMAENVMRVGARETSPGLWTWDNGETAALGLDKFADGEPNDTGDVIQMYRDGTWDDVNYHDTYGFICERNITRLC